MAPDFTVQLMEDMISAEKRIKGVRAELTQSLHISSCRSGLLAAIRAGDGAPANKFKKTRPRDSVAPKRLLCCELLAGTLLGPEWAF